MSTATRYGPLPEPGAVVRFLKDWGPQGEPIYHRGQVVEVSQAMAECLVDLEYAERWTVQSRRA